MTADWADLLRSFYLQTLADLTSPSKLKIFLSGGRGMGKTFLLHELSASRSRESGKKSQIIDGRNWPEALESLAERHSKLNDESSDLLVDNLDRLIAAVGTEDPKSFEDLMTHLSVLISKLPEQRNLCAFTSLFQSNRMADLLKRLESRQEWGRSARSAIDTFSTFMGMYENIQINPWPSDWKKKIGVYVRAYLPGISDPDQCQTLLANLTGGHPALLVPALSHLMDLGKIRNISSISATELKIVIEDAAHERGVGVLRRALNSLRESEREEWRNAYEDLRQFALGNTEAPPRLSREILLGEGLLYSDESSLKYIIPGDILRSELLREPAGLIQMEIDPDLEAPDKHGFLRVWDHARERRIPLSGGAWSVLRVLFEEPARIVSLDELGRRTHLTTENAVRSAIQRLIGDARAHGVSNVLDNLYGKGYRKGESPIWSNLT